VSHAAIVGAGELGGAIAHLLARRDVAGAITLIDETGRVASGKALDIAQAAPIEGFATQLTGSTDFSSAAGAAVVVIAERVSGGEWQGAGTEDGLLLLKRLAQTAPGAAIVCAGASARELVDRGVRELKMSRTRLFGSAPEALAGGARALAALAVNGSPRDVVLTVLGVPPAHVVIPWEDATIAGFGLTRLIDQPAQRRLSAKVTALWPPGPHALAAAAVKAIESIAGRHRQAISCFVAPDADTAARTRTVALPVRLGPMGIVDVMLPLLTVAEQVQLDNAMMT